MSNIEVEATISASGGFLNYSDETIDVLRGAVTQSVKFEKFDRVPRDFRFLLELGGDGGIPDFVKLVLIFTGTNILTEFVKTLTGESAKLLFERFFRRSKERIDSMSESEDANGYAEPIKETVYVIFLHNSETDVTVENSLSLFDDADASQKISSQLLEALDELLGTQK